MEIEGRRRRVHPSVEIELVDDDNGQVVGEEEHEQEGDSKRVIYVATNTNAEGGIHQNNEKEEDEIGNSLFTNNMRRIHQQRNDGYDCDYEDDEAYKKRYWEEWKDGLHSGVILPVVLVTIMNLVWNIAVGSWLATKTSNQIGITEAFLSTFICGTLFAVLGSNPVLIVGVSVPSVIYIYAIYRVADSFSLNFLPWMGWIYVWSAALLTIMAVVKQWTLLLAHQLTMFTWEIVQIFAGLHLVWHGGEEIVNYFTGSGNGTKNGSLVLSLWLVTCSFLLGIVVDGARSCQCLCYKSRQVIADFGPSFLVLALIALPDVENWSQLKLSKIEMPKYGCRSDGSTNLGEAVILKGLPLWAIFLAFIPGALLAALILIDHDSTAFLTSDSEELKGQKIISRRKDLLTLAGSLVLCGFLGLPFGYGLFSQTVRHIRGLTSKMSILNTDGDVESQILVIRRGKVVRVQRVSSLVVSLVIGIPLLPNVDALHHFLNKVPQPLLVGYCLQLGLLNLKDLKLKEYLNDAMFKGIGKGTTCEEPLLLALRLYLVTQMGCVLTIFAVSCTQASLIFPLFLLSALWVRPYIMGRVFHKSQFETFDTKLLQTYEQDTSPTPSTSLRSHLSFEHYVHHWFQSGALYTTQRQTENTGSQSSGSTSQLKSHRNKRKRHSLSTPAELGCHTVPMNVGGNEKETVKLDPEHKNKVGVLGEKSECNSSGSRSLSSSLRFLKVLGLSSSSSLNESSGIKGLSRLPKRPRQAQVGVDVEMEVDIHSNILYDPYSGDNLLVSSENAIFDNQKDARESTHNPEQQIVPWAALPPLPLPEEDSKLDCKHNKFRQMSFGEWANWKESAQVPNASTSNRRLLH